MNPEVKAVREPVACFVWGMLASILAGGAAASLLWDAYRGSPILPRVDLWGAAIAGFAFGNLLGIPLGYAASQSRRGIVAATILGAVGSGAITFVVAYALIQYGISI